MPTWGSPKYQDCAKEKGDPVYEAQWEACLLGLVSGTVGQAGTGQAWGNVTGSWLGGCGQHPALAPWLLCRCQVVFPVVYSPHLVTCAHMGR